MATNDYFSHTSLDGRTVAQRIGQAGYRARLTGPEPDDRDGLDSAAEGLTAALSELLDQVGSRAIPPEAYHVM